MQHIKKNNLLIWLLALMVVFAPMQAAVSAIDMLNHHNGQAPHCNMAMASGMHHAAMDHASKGHGDCCKHGGACQGNCSSCAQCASVHVALFAKLFISTTQVTSKLIPQQISLSKGVTGHSDYRPPRLFS